MNKKRIGERLRELRLKAGFTSMEVAKKCGVSDSTVRMWELGQRTPSDPAKIKIANLYGETIEAIFFA